MQIARGTDEFKYHEEISRVKNFTDEEGMALRKRENHIFKKFFTMYLKEKVSINYLFGLFDTI